MKIIKNLTIGEITKKYPQTIEIFFKYGLHCFGCAISYDETLEQGAKAHGMSDKDVDKMVGEMNKIVK